MTSGKASASRDLYICTSTWKDRQFQKAFNKLDEIGRAAFLAQLEQLYRALETTPHPVSDPKLKQAYDAKPYGGVVSLRGANLVEYSLGPLARVIAKFPASPGTNAVLLLVVTLSHDHDRLKSLIKQYRSDIDSWTAS